MDGLKSLLSSGYLYSSGAMCHVHSQLLDQQLLLLLSELSEYLIFPLRVLKLYHSTNEVHH